MIGSHNTFTYLKPIKWWMRLLTPIARCQTKPIEEQKADVVDIRVKIYNGHWHVSHGPVVYCSFGSALGQCCVNNIRTIRILIEGKYNQDDLLTLKNLIHAYRCKPTNVRFYDGFDRAKWKKVLDVPDLICYQFVGSMQSKYGKIFPFLWSKLNKKLVEDRKEYYRYSGDVALFDFL